MRAPGDAENQRDQAKRTAACHRVKRGAPMEQYITD